MTTPANRGEQTRLALSILTAWVTEGPHFATEYALRQMADDDGRIFEAPILDVVMGQTRLSAVLLATLAEVTGRDPVAVLQDAAKELAE